MQGDFGVMTHLRKMLILFALALPLYSCAPPGYHNEYGMSWFGPYVIPVPNRRTPRLNDVVGTGTVTLSGQTQQVVYVQVPGQDAKPFGIKCDYDEMHGGPSSDGVVHPWPDGPAIWDKYCKGSSTTAVHR